MFSPTRTALYVAIGAMALAASEANAGCKIISGSKICASWIVGSEICQVTVDSTFIGGPPVTVTCSVTGADVFGPDSACPSGALPAGTLICENPPTESEVFTASLVASGTTAEAALAKAKKDKCKHKGKHDGKHEGKDDCTAYSGTPGEGDVPPIVFGGTSDPVTELVSPEVTATCDKDGIICKATAEVLPPDGSTCGEFGPDAIDFTADQFFATATACGDGGEGSCVSLFQLCTRSGNSYDCVDVLDPNENPDCGVGS